MKDSEIITLLKPFEEKELICFIKEYDYFTVDVCWSYDFEGGKKERTKLINLIKKMGFTYRPMIQKYLKLTNHK